MLQEELRETMGQLKQLVEAQRQQQELLSEQQKLLSEMIADKNKSTARPVESCFYCKRERPPEKKIVTNIKQPS